MPRFGITPQVARMQEHDLSPPPPDVAAAVGPLPVRMLNEYTYCKRLFHLMHVDGRFVDNTYTVEGRHVHRRVDAIDHVLDAALPGSAAVNGDDAAGSTDAPSDPEAGDPEPEIVRSVTLTSETLGLTGKLDLVAIDGDEAVPVETKRGRVPDTPERSWPPERVQLMAQALLLREHGYTVTRGVLYFAASRKRVTIELTAELEEDTRWLLRDAHHAAASAVLPPPLTDSPKCRGCSLNGVCLPDETQVLQALQADGFADGPGDDAPPEEIAAASRPGGLPGIRRFFPARPHARPLYVQEPGTRIGKVQSRLTIRPPEGDEISVRIRDLSHVVLCGNVQLSTQTIHLLCESGIPLVFLSGGFWFYGITHGFGLRNAYDRAAQFRTADDPARCLAFARRLVADKAQNQRTLLRRNAAPGRARDAAVRDIEDLLPRIGSAESLGSLLGHEGLAAKAYFSQFGTMLKGQGAPSGGGGAAPHAFDFTKRNRRPPKDPVNALLSFGYAILAKECAVALMAEGLDPHWGLYHQPRHGRPALALDVMEPLRPLVVDSAVLSAINTGMVKQRNFETAASGCVMKPAGRKGFLRAYEARMDQLVTHPIFDYRCSWRAVVQLQARLLSRWLRGDVPEYTSLVTR